MPPQPAQPVAGQTCASAARQLRTTLYFGGARPKGAVSELEWQLFLRDEVTSPWRQDYESFLDYARRHHDIIARFGRFPHRNALLGRESTPEEIEFLKQPGSSF